MAIQDQPKVETNTVTLTIDGQTVTVPKGTNLIEAAKAAGKYVPHYCYHPSLSIDGNCRLCLLEVEKMPKLTIGCNTIATDGMVVHTNSPQVKDAVSGMMEFLLVNHPLDCPVCDRGGECQLQRYSMDYGIGDQRSVDERRKFKKEYFDPLIDLERNRCIVCTRCVRFMDQIGGEHLLGVFNRGNKDCIATYDNLPISTNVFSGNVIDICPVGALTNKPYRFTARPWELQQVQGTCTLCSAGCRITSWVRGGKVYRTTPPTRPANMNYKLDEDTMEFICNAGRFGNDFVNDDERFLVPRVNGEKVAWDAAIAKTIDAFKSTLNEYGARSIGFMVSPRASCEEIFQISRLARAALGTNNIDWRGELIDPAAAPAWSAAFQASTGQLEDPTEYDTVLIINADVHGQAPVSALKIKEAARFGHSKVINIGYRHEEWFASRCSASLRVLPKDIAGFVGELATAIGAEGEPAAEDCAQLAETANCSAATIQKILTQIRDTDNGLLIFGLADLNGLNSASVVRACLDFAGRDAGKWSPLAFHPERNARGAFALGAQPDRIPGGALDHPGSAGRVREHWEAELPKQAGLTCVEMLHAASQGRLKTLFIFGAEVLRSFPDSALLNEALAHLEHLIVMDIFPAELSARAEIVLPGNTYLDHDGTYADLGGCVTRSSAARMLMREGKARLSTGTLAELLRGLGQERVAESPADVFRQIVEFIDQEGELDYDKLAPQGPGGESPIRKAHGDKFARPIVAGKPYSYRSTYQPLFRLSGDLIKGAPSQWRDGKSAAPADGAGLTLVWAPLLFGADPWLDRSQAVEPARRKPVIEIHPQTAADCKLADGDSAQIDDGDAGLRGLVKVTPFVAPGVVFVAQNLFQFDINADLRALPAVRLTKCP